MPTKGDPDEQHTYEGRRQKPRRLFSFDSIKTSASSSARHSSTDHEPPQLNPFELSNVQEVDDEGETGRTVFAPKILRSSTEPTPASTPLNELDFSQQQTVQPGRSRLEPVRPIAIAPVPLRSFTVDSAQATPSPTRARWENLRQHVIPNRPATPPQRSPSAQSSIQNALPPRSNTPKPSRLARLGFRHVVEQARDVIDESRKLGEEIKRACAIARYGEQTKPSKDSSMTTLTGSGTTTSSVIASGKKNDYLRRPQSISATSLPLTNSSSSNGPSLRFLHQILLYHSTESSHANTIHLPFETQVLSTLLCPFLVPSKYPYMRVEEEQMTSVEAFELVTKSWAPADEASTVSRALWCTRAAASLSPTSTRTRILGSLWRILVPGDRNKILLTPHGSHSISSGLLLLLAALYRTLQPSTVGANHYSRSPSFKTSKGFSFASANFQQPPHPDINLVQDLIQQFLSGSLGEVEDDKIEEVYAAEYTIADRRNPGNVRRALFTESLITTIENSPGTGEWLLCNTVERYWPPPVFETWSTLQAVVSSRKINSFCRLSTSFLKPFITSYLSTSTPAQPSRLPSSSTQVLSVDNIGRSVGNPAVATEIVATLESRIIPEAEALDSETEVDASLVAETRKLVAATVLELLCLNPDVSDAIKSSGSGMDVFGAPLQSLAPGNEIQTVVKWARGMLCRWHESNDLLLWKPALEQALSHIILTDWSNCIYILSALLKHLPDNIKKSVFPSVSVVLNDQLVEQPPPYPSLRMSELLTSLSRSLPPIFFKPLFACGASDKDIVVINHLCTLQVHSKYIQDYWVRDVDMLCFAILGSAKNLQGHESPGAWGVARLGQLVLLVELIGHIQILRHQKEDSQAQADGSFNETLRFATALEARVWSMIEFQEKNEQLSPSLRMLLCILFRELRLLTRSLKPAPWLARTLQWFHTYVEDEHIGELEQGVTRTIERVQELYLTAQAGVQERHKRHTSILAASVHKAAPPPDPINNERQLNLAETFLKHRKLIDSLSRGYISKALKLFVAMSTMLPADESTKLAPLVWQHCLLDNADSTLTASACFILMQCTEKAPMDVRAVIELDMQSSDDTTRLEAVHKVSILINWRFQLMNQNFVSDRTHRPFKLARPPLPFLATDIGSSLYVPFEEPKETKDKDDVPLELKKRLADLGWTEEDGVVIDPRHEWIKTPFSILPVNQWDRQEVSTTDVHPAGPPSPLGSPHPSPRKVRLQRDNLQQMPQPDEVVNLLRRNSSSGGPLSGVKRRAVFVPALTLIFPRLCTLLFDSNFTVVAAARTTILDLMRNDPALLTRPILDLLAGENRDLKLAISTFTALLHVRRVLPPPAAHNMFNHLAGFLKLLARDEKMPNALEDFGQILPIMSSLATQVSNISMREIRRAKIEHFVIPTGSLWFPSGAPKGSMFPRSLGESENPFEPVSSRLVSVTMVRVAQNMFFLSMLKRNFQDVQIVRKNMSALILPSLEDDGLSKNLELYDFMPKKLLPDTRPSLRNGEVEILSLMVARSSILLIAQIFRSMPRHLSDRNELAILVDGLNRALVAHGDDINIVSHVLIALMVASTRFRRLFTTGGGYTLFMPALVKVYTETPSHPGIRNAIEYAINRFYALHKDSFLYQTINTMGQMTMLPEMDSLWFSKGVYDLFTSLRRGVSASAADIGGIYNANKAEEREALILHTADEKPQTFLAAIKRVESESGRHMSFQLPDEYESNRLDMPDLVRLFWTIIAHDLSISRAQHFLRLLLFLTPHLYNSSSKTKTVLSDGIDALGQILVKAFAKPKLNENMLKSTTAREEDTTFLNSSAGLQDSGKERSRSPSDTKQLRLDYLRLIVAFGSSGGQVSLAVARYAFDIVRSLLKDWGNTNMDVLSRFLDDFMKMLLNREEHATPKAIVAFLRELSPLLHSHMTSLDFSGVFETVLRLSEMQIYASDSGFCQVVVEEICTAGLAACDLAASENQLMALPCRPVLISLLAESVFLKATDVIGELEKRPPTYQYLAGVILPLVLAMKTEIQVATNGLMTEQHRIALAAAWVRILSYSMTACQKSRKDADGTRQLRSLAGSFTRSKSGGKGQKDAFWRSHLPTFMTALQVIKVIVIRGGADISYLPRIGIWERLAEFFKAMLADGNANFALKMEGSSTASTPTGSPRSSRQFNLSNSASTLFVSTPLELSRPSSPLSHVERQYAQHRPRIIDYSLWSVLEFACAYRSPLRMQLKVLTMEKIVALDQALLHQVWSRGGGSPIPPSPSSRRVSTSLFSKSRQRVSGFLGPSPDSSPRMMPSSSSLIPSPSMLEIPSRLEIPKLEIPSRRPGYQVSPISPQDRPAGLPKIVHLGPVSPSALTPNVSPLIGGIKPTKSGTGGAGADTDGDASVAKATKIRSLKLIHETYRRIRGVQAYMGYELLLPIPGTSLNTASSRDRDEEAGLETWTTSQALNAVVRETRDLLEEFEESFAADEESVMVELDQTTSNATSPI